MAGVLGGSAPTDVHILFEGDVRLEVISDSSGYEPWQLQAPGLEVIASGGDQVFATRSAT